MARLGTLWVAVAVLGAAWFSGNAGCSSSGGGKGGTSGAGSGGKGGNGDLSGAAGVSPGGAGTGGGSGGTPAAGGASANGGGGAAAGTSGSLGGTSSGGAAGHQAGSGGAGGTPAQGSGGAAGAAGRPGAAGTPGQTGGNPGTAGTGAAAGGGTAGMAGGTGAGGTSSGGTSAGGAGGSAPRGTPDALILLDRSGSMNEMIDGSTCPGNGCGENSKWGLVTSAIEQVLPLDDTAVRWGLKLFASSTSNTCLVTSGVEVAPALSTGATIATRIAATAPGSSTPTTAAVTAAGTYLASLSDGAPKFIVLVTDGVPTCGTAACDLMPNVANQCDDANAIAAVKSVHDTLGIPTFVVGIGIAPIGGGEATLSAMATNGGYPRAASPVYYPANTTADITASFMAIAATIAP